jgi:hypothetical protein
VGRRLLEFGQKDIAIGLANRLNVNPPVKADAAPVQTPVLAQLVALLLAIDKADKAAELLPPPGEKATRIDALTRIAYAQGKALKGDFPAAREMATRKGGAPLDKLRALLAVAAVALGQGKADEAKASLGDAFAAEEDLKKAKIDNFHLLQLARLAARAGLEEKAAPVAERITDKAARASAHLELLRARLSKLKGDRTTAEPKLVDDLVKDKDTLAYALGQEAVARHNARLNQRDMVLEYLDSLEERFRPFAQMGIALGIQDKEKRQ